MKRFFFLSVFALSAAALVFSPSESQAQKVINSGNAKATGGNGGNAKGAFSKAGNGGNAFAQSALIQNKGVQQIINSNNATATGGNGGNAKGFGSKAGNGGSAVALSANAATTKLSDLVSKGKGTKGGPVANAGNATATGGNGGNASGPGSKGGNGGDAIAVSGNGNTVINGNGNVVNNGVIINKVTNNNISFAIGGGGFGGGRGFGGGGFGGGGFVTSGPLAIAGGGGDGFIQGSPGIAIASAPGELVIREDGAPAVAVGQQGKDSGEEAEKEEVFTRRMLKLKNEADVPVKVFVQYRELVSKKWQWLPVDPSQSQDAVSYDLKPGQELLAEHQGKKLAASRVRIWVASEKAQWNDYKDTDLWLVPETDAQGQHRYLATEMKTFTFVVPATKAAE